MGKRIRTHDQDSQRPVAKLNMHQVLRPLSARLPKCMVIAPISTSLTSTSWLGSQGAQRSGSRLGREEY